MTEQATMRLLLVEDDPPLRTRLEADLRGAGYAVDVVDNGLDASHAGQEIPYDFVILDLGLPDRPGLDVLTEWRTSGLTVPVLILTARSTWQEKVTGLQAGADDYLAKPFHTDELLARLTALGRRSHAPPEAMFQQGDWSLDEASQQVRLNGTTIDLTGTEFRLLRYLMHHPGVVLSKSQLTEHVYDFDSDKDSNVIEVYIRRLRRKLGEDVITTRRGQGYVFEGGA